MLAIMPTTFVMRNESCETMVKRERAILSITAAMGESRGYYLEQCELEADKLTKWH